VSSHLLNGAFFPPLIIRPVSTFKFSSFYKSLSDTLCSPLTTSLYTNFLSIPPVQPQDAYIRLDVFTYKRLLDGDVGCAHMPLALSASYPSFFFLSSFVPLHTYYSVADDQWPLPVLELSFFESADWDRGSGFLFCVFGFHQEKLSTCSSFDFRLIIQFSATYIHFFCHIHNQNPFAFATLLCSSLWVYSKVVELYIQPHIR